MGVITSYSIHYTKLYDKETVQNLLVFRFANSIFEPIWNRDRVDNIQITVAEDIGSRVDMKVVPTPY